MKVDVEEINSVKKSLKIEVPEEVVAKEISSAYTDLNRRVLIPGFRKGKAPLSLLEQRYASSVEEDVIRKLIPDYYRKAIEETGLHPVELPAIEKVKLKKNAPLSFTALIEIAPSIQLVEYTGLKVSRPTMEVGKIEMDRALEALQEQQAQLVSCPEGHPIAEKDFVLMDIEEVVDGLARKEGTQKNQLLQIGSKTMLPGLEEEMINHQRGDRVKWKGSFPKDDPRPDRAGRSVEYDVTIREIKQKVLPALDDEFAKDVGKFTSLDELKKKLREDLTLRTKQEQERAVKEGLMKQLTAAHAFEVPASLVEREIQEVLARLQQRLPKGVTLEKANFDPEAFRKEVEPAARDKVKGRLILQAIADQEKLTVSKEELETALSKTAQELKIGPEDVRRLILSREGNLDVFKERLREDKTLEWVVSKAVIKSSAGPD